METKDAIVKSVNENWIEIFIVSKGEHLNVKKDEVVFFGVNEIKKTPAPAAAIPTPEPGDFTPEEVEEPKKEMVFKIFCKTGISLSIADSDADVDLLNHDFQKAMTE